MENQAFNPLVPDTILFGRYKILNLIRQGGMGATYYGEDLVTKRLVAIKEFVDTFNTLDDRESGIRNFLAEINVLQTIRHPQIPKILNSFVEKRGFFFVQEYIRGKDLTTILEEIGRQGFPEEKVLQWGIHLCRILSYLHKHKPFPVVHRDIKPSNIMLRDEDQRIMLVDFGISKAAKPKEGMMIGTLGYSPPEQHLNTHDKRADIYSLGATLHELSTGQKPNPESFEFLPPNELNTQLSSSFSSVILKALSYYPEERFQDAESFEEALQANLGKTVPWIITDPFEEACHRFAKDCLFPCLLEIKSQYPNECQTSQFPEFLDYFVFTLGIHTPCELIVQSDASECVIHFLYREGLLPAKPLINISPHESDACQQIETIVKLFMKLYQTASGTSM